MAKEAVEQPVGQYDLDQLLGEAVGDMTKSEVLPEGVFHVRIGKAEVRPPKEPTKKNAKTGEIETKFPYVNWDLVVTGRSPEELHGRHLYDIGSLKPGATFTNRQYLEALGFSEETTLKEALELINSGEYELLVGVAIQKEGEGPDGKWYPEKNKITRRLPLEA